jgi:membrane-associated protein
MDLKKYLLFSAIGAFLWAVGVTLLGYFLGNIEFVKKNIDLILILIIVVSLTPVMFEYIRHKRAKAA